MRSFSGIMKSRHSRRTVPTSRSQYAFALRAVALAKKNTTLKTVPNRKHTNELASGGYPIPSRGGGVMKILMGIDDSRSSGDVLRASQLVPAVSSAC